MLSLHKSSKQKLYDAEKLLFEITTKATGRTKLEPVKEFSPLKDEKSPIEVEKQPPAPEEAPPAAPPPQVVDEVNNEKKSKKKKDREKKKSSSNNEDDDGKVAKNPWLVQMPNYSPVNYTAKSVLADLSADVDLLAL